MLGSLRAPFDAPLLASLLDAPLLPLGVDVAIMESLTNRSDSEERSSQRRRRSPTDVGRKNLSASRALIPETVVFSQAMKHMEVNLQ